MLTQVHRYGNTESSYSCDRQTFYDAGFIGLALTYALTLTGSLEGALGIFVETERKMVALERVDEYIQNIEIESYNVSVNNNALPYAWPSQGVISFVGVSLKYRFVSL